MSAWTYVDLQDDQLALVREAERTLSSDVVLAFIPVDEDEDDEFGEGNLSPGLPPARLTESELECLQGLEARFGAVLVAYRAG